MVHAAQKYIIVNIKTENGYSFSHIMTKFIYKCLSDPYSQIKDVSVLSFFDTLCLISFKIGKLYTCVPESIKMSFESFFKFV